jgi:chorismate mutase
MSVRAIRGATQVAADTPEDLRVGVQELIREILSANSLKPAEIISILFTATPDLVSDFPAASARGLGLEAVPLICAVEIAVPGSLPRTIRAMVHCETALKQDEISHIYLHGAKALRKDLAQ